MKDLDQKLPLSLKYLQNLIDRVAKRYPYLKKYEIVLIVKKFFEVLRFELLSKKIVSLNGFFAHLKLISFKKNNKNTYQVIKTKLSTPRKMRNGR